MQMEDYDFKRKSKELLLAIKLVESFSLFCFKKIIILIQKIILYDDLRVYFLSSTLSFICSNSGHFVDKNKVKSLT